MPELRNSLEATDVLSLVPPLGIRGPHEQSLVRVDEEKCLELAKILASVDVPLDQEEICFSNFENVETGNFLLFAVAICHQTSGHGDKPLQGIVRGKKLRGWDYLIQRLEEECQNNRGLLLPDLWKEMSPETLRAIFADQQGECLLTDLDGRSRLVRDLGQKMQEMDVTFVQNLFDKCEGRIRSDNPCILEQLSNFEAYSDPVFKKSFFFLSLMQNSGVWSFTDPENLGPPVDYHEVRGHLRIGTVHVESESLRNKLLHKVPVEAKEDIALRKATLNAILLMSKASGLNRPSQLHYLFWNLFRTYCTREDPNCNGDRPERYLPKRYLEMVSQVNDSMACPFCQICKSASQQVMLYDHVFQTDYY